MEALLYGKRYTHRGQGWKDRKMQGMQGLEITKREHNIDITLLLKGQTIEDADWNGKEQPIKEAFIWQMGPEALYQINRAEYKTSR